MTKTIVYVGGPQDGKRDTIQTEALPPVIAVNTIDSTSLPSVFDKPSPIGPPVTRHIYTLSVLYLTADELDGLYRYAGFQR